MLSLQNGLVTVTALLPRSAPVDRTVKTLQGAEFPGVMRAKLPIFPLIKKLFGQPALADHGAQFRELFKRRLVENEDVFAIPGDAWHKNSTSGTGPDGNYGTAPEFAEALASGECAFAYVSGVDTPFSSRTPLIANAFSHSVGVYSKSTSQKGGVFGGTKSFYVSVGGSAHTVDLSSDCKVMVKYGPRILDVFSNDFGTNPDDVKNPL